MSSAYTVTVFSEDKSPHTGEALTLLLQGLLQRFGEDGYTELLSIHVVREHWAAFGNRWRATKPRPETRQAIIELRRAIASALRQPDRSVVFHYDADVTWARRTECATRSQFDKQIREPVRHLLMPPPDGKRARIERSDHTRARAPSPFASADAENQLGKLIECVPHYSIEAWLYQATGRAIELCRQHYAGRDVERFESWQSDRALLDEVDKPKDNSVLSDRHNHELGSKVPLSEVVAVGKSLAAFRDALLDSPELKNRVAPIVRGGT